MKDIKEHKHILICGDNRNSLCIIRSLGEKGINPLIILQHSGNNGLLASSRYCRNIIYASDHDDAMQKLIVYADEMNPPFVYLTDDNHLQLLDEQYEQIKNKFYFFNAGAMGRITDFLEKEHQCELARKCGFNVPSYEVVEHGKLPKTLSYPVITKTSNSYSAGWKRDVTICYSPDELMHAYEAMISERLILQEYIEKTGEYYLQGISINGGEDVYIPFEARYLHYSKTSFGGYSKYRVFEDQDMLAKIKKMILEIHFSGCFEVEFLIDKDQQLHFLEINMRFSGANYGVNIGGVNLPYVWAQSTLGNKIDTENLVLRQSPYYVVNDMMDFQFAKETGYLKWLKQMLLADGYYLFNRKDLKPFFHFWFGYKMKRLFKKLL